MCQKVIKGGGNDGGGREWWGVRGDRVGGGGRELGSDGEGRGMEWSDRERGNDGE